MNNMDLLRVFSVLLLTSSLCGVCLCDEECEIDFHMESPSVMALAGSDAGALCDATCFGHYGDLEVAWLDPAGHEIDTASSRISTVLENGGLMSRLLIQATSRKDSGTYVCSVMRSGEILEEKPLSFFVFGDFDYEDTKIKDDGPRRGDIVPRKDFDYRPVRSLDRILAGLSSARSSVNVDKTRSGDLDNGIQILPKKIDKTGWIFGIQTAGYKRKGPNDMETAPLTLLADPELANDAKPGFENPVLFDADTSLSSEDDDDDKDAAAKNMGNNNKESGHVTTFLLRQLSQKDSNEKQSQDVSGRTAGDEDLSFKPDGESGVSNDANHHDGSTLHGSTINSSRHHPEHEDDDVGTDSVILV